MVSRYLGTVGTNTVEQFINHDGRHMFKLTGAEGFVRFTWEELFAIIDLVEDARAKRKGGRFPAPRFSKNGQILIVNGFAIPMAKVWPRVAETIDKVRKQK